MFTFNPDFGQAGEYDFTVQVSNGEQEDEHAFKVIVEPVNRPPAFTTTFDEESIEEGDEFQFQFEAEDPDDDQLTFSLINGNDIENASITTNGLFTFNPESGQAGIYGFTVLVSDGDLFDEHDFEITVEAGSGPKVEKGVQFNNQFSIPEDMKVTCMSGDTEPVFTNALICDVMVWGDLTYWALSDIDNWSSMAIVAVNPEGEIVQRWDRDGARYLWKIILDKEAETATFVGQSHMSFTMNWDELRVE